MMDFSDAKQSFQNTEDVRSKSESEILKQETASNIAPEEVSGDINSENIAAGEKTPALYRQRNGYFEKESESYEIIKNICESFNVFQKTIAVSDQATFLNDAFYESASITERSPTSCASGNLLPNTAEPRIRVITEINERDGDIDQNVKFLRDALKDYVSVKGSSSISCATGDILPNTSESRIRAITETKERDVQENGTIPTPASPTMTCSTSRSTIIPKCENVPPISNARFFKREMHCDVFKEDDDWDIYQPGFEMTKTKSLQESEPSFERQMNEIAEYWANNEAKRSLDFSSCQKVSPSTERGIRYSQTDNFVNNGGTFREWKIKGMLWTVEKFFLENPVQVPDNLGDLEREMCITTTPYFSRDFSLRHGLTPFTVSSILQTNLPKDPSTVSKLFAAYEMISSLGLSEEDFFHYIDIEEQRRACEWNGSSKLNPKIISELDLMQEHVGTDIFYMVYEKLRTDEYSRALLRNPELLKYASLFWNECEKNIDHLEDEPTNIEYNEADSISDVVTEDIYFSETNADFPSPSSGSRALKTLHHDDLDSNPFFDDGISEDIFVSRANADFPSPSSGSRALKTLHHDDLDSNPFSDDGISEDIFVSRTNADLPSTTSGSRAIKTPDLNDLNLNPYADDRKEEDVKNSQNSKDLPKGQSVKPNDILEAELKCSPMMQSNEDNNENLSSFDLLQGCSDKYPDIASFMLQRTENSSSQYDEKTQRKVHLETSRTSQNKATHSSGQTFQGKSIDDQSEKSFKALENVSIVQPRVRKYSSQDGDAVSIKKIRLQENPNSGRLKSNKEKTPRKEKSRCPCHLFWPKPRNKSCIIM